MSTIGWIGAALAAVGVCEFGLYALLARTNAGIARRRRLLNINAGVNVVVGLTLFLIFR
jgi:hypothetical protein